MPCIATPRQLLDKFTFIVQCDFLPNDAGFTTMSELKMSTETVEYRAGGSIIPSKSPGLTSFDPVTFTRGATRNINDLYNWKRRVTDGAVSRGYQQGFARGGVQNAGFPGNWCCPMMVHHTNRSHKIVKSWLLVNAWPSELSVADGLDNNASERVIESATFEYDYFIRVDRKTASTIINDALFEAQRAIDDANSFVADVTTLGGFLDQI